ncbi:hypothetical protein [Desulfobacterium sp. N47]|uniref:Uncharacterized protein n=1 Tax=uncultured Desulfobacterium sp. TaxID=201089 RepID=E1YA09_9BACT|nr:hypothetical protein N47_H22250 [uncultured Desulfobacterium sp.]
MADLLSADQLNVFDYKQSQKYERPSLFKMMNALGVNNKSPDRFIESIPFSLNDTTAGSESELQAAVCGDAQHVDLPITIFESNYFKNIIKKAQTGDSSQKAVDALRDHLNSNPDNIWENSWVRVPINKLSLYARQIMNCDLLLDKKHPEGKSRTDISQFKFIKNGVEFIKIPISYIFKLALADAVGKSNIPDMIKVIAEQIMDHFISDNTSPETYSFHPVHLNKNDNFGESLAGETLIRFLLCQLLIRYANKEFNLEASGQKAMFYFSPHPPLRQKKLNSLISDSFYRYLFMSPCLSGWDRGEEKHKYMGLCHRTLSISQLNAISKLKEAGIITRNLVVLPSTSNISLANNGTHISLGSKHLTGLLKDPASGINANQEKYFGDLVIKVVEHFLPLFAGTYSAAPYRLNFSDFHPEHVLGFLPHELDFTHLRMIWRRWKKKADISMFGNPVTPFGPQWLDRMLSRVFRLKGDYIIDYRLIDYFVSVLSTWQSPALNGKMDSEYFLKEDLSAMGVFDSEMPLYLLYRLRSFDKMGFSGFEGRYYSLFESVRKDMGEAANLQMLITALAYKYIFTGRVAHAHIPNDPTIESERRQIFFGTAIGIPTFYVKNGTRNRFLTKILRNTENTRSSNRYAGYIRVRNDMYRQALIKIIRKDAADLIEMMDLKETIDSLERRITQPSKYSSAGRLTKQILDDLNVSNPLKATGDKFNNAAEKYYRGSLKKQHINEAFDFLIKYVSKLDDWPTWREGYYNNALLFLLDGKNAVKFLESQKEAIINEDLSKEMAEKVIWLTLLTIHMNKKNYEKKMKTYEHT